MGEILNSYYQYCVDFLKLNYDYVLVVMGLFIMFGAFRKWEWMIVMQNTKLIGIRTFIKEAYGDEALWKFQRFITFLGGLALFLFGIISIYIR